MLPCSADHEFLRRGRFSLTGEGVGRTMPMSESGAQDVASEAAPRRRRAVCETPQTGESKLSRGNETDHGGGYDPTGQSLQAPRLSGAAADAGGA